ncbi:MAG: hypothetical protein RBR23_00540 [Arcobacteraceae bacterium]|jgi:hypothetical protein|nr:hypothetical protein [Arcobacteraceae bacterium]
MDVRSVVITFSIVFLTKYLDDILNSRKGKREFKQKIRLQEIDEIENIFNKISMYYEVFSSYYPIEYKKGKLKTFYEEEFILLAKCHKYNDLVQPTRDFLHLFKIMASDSFGKNIQIEDKKKLHSKFKEIKNIIEKFKNSYNN